MALALANREFAEDFISEALRSSNFNQKIPAHPSLERRSRTKSLNALPSTVLPSRAALADFTTGPICFMEVALFSAMALVTAASISSVERRGRYSSMMAASFFSFSASSGDCPC